MPGLRNGRAVNASRCSFIRVSEVSQPHRATVVQGSAASIFKNCLKSVTVCEPSNLQLPSQCVRIYLLTVLSAERPLSVMGRSSGAARAVFLVSETAIVYDVKWRDI